MRNEQLGTGRFDVKSQFLDELRIDRSQREAKQTPPAFRLALAAVVLLAALAAGGYVLFARDGVVTVQTASAIAPTGQSTAVLQASGYVVAEREATISAQIQGMLTQVDFQEGQYVRRGQILARLDDGTQRAVLVQARAQWAAAQAQLLQLRVQLKLAHFDLSRDQALIGQHLVSEQALDNARTQFDSLAAQVLTQRHNVTVARAGVQAAEVQEDYTVVRAPFSGVVVDKPAQMGETISPFFGGGGFTQTGIATIVDMNSLEVDVDVNEAYIDRVHAGQPAVAVLDAYPNWHIPAHVIAIVPTANKSKATVRVRVALESRDPRILPQMGVRVSFLQPPSAHARAGSGLPADMVWVPASSVVRRGASRVIFVVAGGRARVKTVLLGALRAGLRAVSGIDAGSTVVRRPPRDLADGDRVTVEKD